MKKMFFFLLASLSAWAGQAVVLYWKVDLQSPSSEYAYAALYTTDNTSSPISIAEIKDGRWTVGDASSPVPTDVESDLSDVQELSTKTFYIQMLNSQGQAINSACSDKSLKVG